MKSKLETSLNTTAIREALKTLRQRFDNDVMAYQDRYFRFSEWHWNKKAAEAAKWRDVFGELRDVCDAALSDPPRNCDVGTPAEQSRRFREFCHLIRTRSCDCSDDCPFIDEPDIIHCELSWAQMPYEEKKNGSE